ncbi:unnamed protein product, partial [Mesorhabditis spiculigera]
MWYDIELLSFSVLFVYSLVSCGRFGMRRRSKKGEYRFPQRVEGRILANDRNAAHAKVIEAWKQAEQQLLDSGRPVAATRPIASIVLGGFSTAVAAPEFANSAAWREAEQKALTSARASEGKSPDDLWNDCCLEYEVLWSALEGQKTRLRKAVQDNKSVHAQVRFPITCRNTSISKPPETSQFQFENVHKHVGEQHRRWTTLNGEVVKPVIDFMRPPPAQEDPDTTLIELVYTLQPESDAHASLAKSFAQGIGCVQQAETGRQRGVMALNHCTNTQASNQSQIRFQTVEPVRDRQAVGNTHSSPAIDPPDEVSKHDKSVVK